MIRDEQLRQLREKIGKAIPDFEEFESTCCGGCEFGCNRERPTRLADVLLALQKERPTMHTVSTNGSLLQREDTHVTPRPFASRFLSTGHIWNLRQDFLTDQSDETIAFLRSLLCP